MAGARPLVGALGLVATAALPIFLTGSLAPELREDFAFGDALLGITVGAFFAVSTIASAPAGRLVARIGSGAAVRLTAALAVGCSLGVALLASSAANLIAILAIGGLGNALSSPAATAVVTRDLAGERHGVGYGALTAGAPIGSVLAGLALPLVAEPFDWRLAFLGAAALAVVTALVAGVRGDHPLASARMPPAEASAGAREWTSVHTFALAAGLASAASTGLISFLVVFAVDSGMSGGEAGALLAATGLAAAVSRVGLGTHADRAPERATTNLLGLLVGACAGLLLLISGEPVLIVVGALMAGGFGWGWAGLVNLIAVREGRYDPAEAVGIVMTGLFLGALLGPVVIGQIAESAGFEFAWLFASVCVIAAAVTLGVANPRAAGNKEILDR